MASLTLRVAARYSQALKVAAFIPDKFFKGYAAELKKVFSQKLERNVLEHAIRLIRDEVIPLHERFIRELTELAPKVTHQSLTDRLGQKLDQIKRLSQSLVDSNKAIDFPSPVTTTRAHVLLHIHSEVLNQLEEKFSTLGKLFKTQVSIDPEKVQALVSKALQKMPSEVADAIDADDYAPRNSKLKHDYYDQQIDKSIPRLIKKDKVIIDWVGWFERIRDVLEANYSEPLLHTADLYGMKVVINDAVITPKDHAGYIHYLDKAYQLLKKKKLDRAWYGNVFIECEGCGGVNQNTGKEDVAGHYYIGKDWVQIYNRPGEEIVHIMVHELGHRYWFKSMSRGQRARFEAYVRARIPEKGVEKDRVPHVLESRVLQEAKKRLEATRVEVNAFIDHVEQTDPTEAPAISWARRVENRSREVLDMYFAAKVVRDVDHPESAERDRKRAQEAVEKASEHLLTLPDVMKKTGDDLAMAVHKWCDQARELVDAAESQASGYAVGLFTEYNKIEEAKKKERDEKRQKAWDADEREILPVSEYGKSNIDEAFAEAFAWYVLDRKMTEDQKGIFRSVLLRQDRVAARVARRWSHRLV